MAEPVAATKEPGWNKSRTAVRLVFLIAAFALLWAGSRQFTRMTLTRSVTYTSSYGAWLAWVGLIALCGFAFGLACWLPRRVRFRWGIAVLLGLIPFLMTVHVSMFEGPNSLVRFVAAHFHSLMNFYFFDRQPFVPVVLLGVAIAAGFAAD
jgi:hypothetical protein